MIPRWAIFLFGGIVLIWFFSNPAGFADFLLQIADAIGVFFERITK